MPEKDKKYYWLRLKEDFFQQHKIKVLKSMPNGRLYALIYLELLTESVSHEGQLRFSKMLPYDANTLSAVIDEDKEDLENAIEVLKGLELAEIQDDKTIYMSEIQKLIGSESYWAEQKRNKRLLDNVQRMSNECPTCPSKRLDIRDKSIDNKENIKRKAKPFTPPTVKDVKTYCDERHNGVDAERFIDFYESKGWMVGKNKMKDWKACVRTWEKSNIKERTKDEKVRYEMDLSKY